MYISTSGERLLVQQLILPILGSGDSGLQRNAALSKGVDSH
jgi:hypothetical protein